MENYVGLKMRNCFFKYALNNFECKIYNKHLFSIIKKLTQRAQRFFYAIRCFQVHKGRTTFVKLRFIFSKALKVFPNMKKEQTNNKTTEFQ